MKRTTIELTPEQLEAMKKVIAPFYRTQNMSHAFRLMIEDVAKGIENDGQPVSRFGVVK